MSFADDVRRHVDVTYIQPARASGRSQIEVLVGDVHRELGYSNRYPLVCSALGSLRFEDDYRVRRLSVEGPLNGSSTLFRFEVLM